MRRIEKSRQKSQLRGYHETFNCYQDVGVSEGVANFKPRLHHTNSTQPNRTRSVQFSSVQYCYCHVNATLDLSETETFTTTLVQMPPIAVAIAKRHIIQTAYRDQYVSLSVYLLAYLRNHWAEFYQFLCVVRVAVARSSYDDDAILMYFRFCGRRHVFTQL